MASHSLRTATPVQEHVLPISLGCKPVSRLPQFCSYLRSSSGKTCPQVKSPLRPLARKERVWTRNICSSSESLLSRNGCRKRLDADPKWVGIATVPTELNASFSSCSGNSRAPAILYGELNRSTFCCIRLICFGGMRAGPPTQDAMWLGSS